MAEHGLGEAERASCLEKVLTYCLDATLSDEDLKRLARVLDEPSKGPSKRQQSPHDTNHKGSLFPSQRSDHDGFTVKVLSESRTNFSGELSLSALSQRIKQTLVEKLQIQELDEEEEMPHAVEHGSLAEEYSTLQAALDHLPPRQIACFLVDTFFQYAQTNDFFVDKRWIDETIDACYESPWNLMKEDLPSICSILTVMAIGTQFAHMSSHRSIEQIAQSSGSTTGRFSEDELGRKFYQTASDLLPGTIRAASFDSVQACLLMATYNLPIDTPGLAYTYLGLALHIAIQNGMHQKPSELLSRRMREIRNRVWWTLYTFYQ